MMCMARLEDAKMKTSTFLQQKKGGHKRVARPRELAYTVPILPMRVPFQTVLAPSRPSVGIEEQKQGLRQVG